MYVRLRAASTKPVCRLCACLSPPQIPRATDPRHHTTQAQTVLQPPISRLCAQPASSSSSVSSTPLALTKRLLTVHPAVKTKRKTPNAVEPEVKLSRKALKEAQETERRRKALATLGKTTKFIAAGLNETHEPTSADLDRFKPPGPPPITLDFVFPEPTSPSYIGTPTPSSVERYKKAFQKHVNTLTSKFQRKQLLKLYKEGVQTRTSKPPGTPKKVGSLKNSQDIACEIVRWLWHWPYIKEVEEKVSYMTSKSGRGALGLFWILPISVSSHF